MKRICTAISIALFCGLVISCAKEKEKKNYEAVNHLKQFSKVRTQTFVLDTTEFKKIIGEQGTKIYFNRYDLNVSDSDSVVLKLEEYYSFKELLFNQLQTITDKDELLSSSGVIKVNFYVNDQEVFLKEGRSLRIEFPKGTLEGNDLYNGEKDSLNNITWRLQEKTDTIIRINKGTQWQPVIYEIIIDKDSIKFYKDQEVKRDPLDYVNVAFMKKLNWVNVDKLVTVDGFVSIDLESNLNKMDTYLSCYAIYESSNAFQLLLLDPDNLKYENVTVRGTTRLLFIGKSGDTFYSDEFLLEEGKEIFKKKLNLKKTTLEKFAQKLDEF